MKNHVIATIAVLAVLALTLGIMAQDQPAAGGRGQGRGQAMGGGMGMGMGARGGRGATPVARPARKERLAALDELAKQIATLKAAIEKGPATDPNIATLEGDSLTKFMAQYTEESEAINQIATTVNSLRGAAAGGRGGRGGFGGANITTDVLSELRVLAQNEKATKTMARLDVLIQQAQTTGGRGQGRGAGAGAGAGAGRGARGGQ